MSCGSFLLYCLLFVGVQGLWNPERLDPLQILTEFYYATNGDSWYYYTNWLNVSVSFCLWHGISCNGDQIVGFRLPSNNLKGIIPPSFGQLTNLQHLEIGDNHLIGTIPSSFGQLTNLQYLGLSQNQLTGVIPPSFAQFTNLTSVDLHANQLSGTIPSLSQLNNLIWLYVNRNQFTGIDYTPKKPPKIADCNMSVNSFKCPIPDWTKLFCVANCN